MGDFGEQLAEWRKRKKEREEKECEDDKEDDKDNGSLDSGE